jgi:CDP-diacylglycerol--serine O-phosphatidyltransferase
MIGFYNYSVILTYLGLGASIFGMKEALIGMVTPTDDKLHFMIAVLCLAFSGLCDTFDGKIARSMKGRSKEAEIFGVQIDSLCDVVCFGVFPALFAYCLGMRGFLGVLILIAYVLGAIIRLAFFNVQDEIRRTGPPTEEKKSYRGLPVTSIAIIFPIIYLFRSHMNPSLFHTILTFSMLAISFLFVLDFKIRKPSNQLIALYIIFVAIVILKILGVF